MSSFDYSNYISPFTWRYGSEGMRKIFSEKHKYELWRKVWVSLAKVQHNAGLLTDQELQDLEKNQQNIALDTILTIENETKHDVVAAIKEYSLQASVGGGKIHLGMTSMDVVDNVEIMRMSEALIAIEKKVKEVLQLLAKKIEMYADTPCLGYTHLQPAEPTTLGYRFAFYAQDLLMDLRVLQFLKQHIVKAKGIKGAVGSQASFEALLQSTGEDAQMMEQKVMSLLGIEALEISTQVYTRKIDYLVLVFLAGLSSSLAKFAGDVRILQSPSIGEWSEAFGEKQVGSSAMPFKKNPINAEKICSLARLVAGYPHIALENASVNYLERTLDDSANKRVIIPEAFLSTDEILSTALVLVQGLQINTKRIAGNLDTYAPFSASESILLAAVKKGADRQQMHEILRQIALVAWEEIQKGHANPMKQLLLENEKISVYLSAEDINTMMHVSSHIGTAPKRAKNLLLIIRKILA